MAFGVAGSVLAAFGVAFVTVSGSPFALAVGVGMWMIAVVGVLLGIYDRVERRG